MSKKIKIALPFLLALIFGLVLYVLTKDHGFALLDSKGVVAEKQKNLIIFATTLSMFVVLPVYGLLFYILWKYREGNKKATYLPNWDGSRILETIWWGVPIVLILILSVVTWRSTYDLDPFKPLAADQKPLKIQVVALQWKWLFIYPEQGIATVNYIQIPKDQPVEFEITADAPMNSFWIPNLGGQIYAMSGMSTKMNLSADQIGTFQGSSANISGEGFSGMRFEVQSNNEAGFDAWVTNVQESSQILDMRRYDALSQPSEDDPSLYFGNVEPQLYQNVLRQYTFSGFGSDPSHKESH